MVLRELLGRGGEGVAQAVILLTVLCQMCCSKTTEIVLKKKITLC